MSHYPVMLPEVLEALSPQDGGVYVDGTFGAGGYTRAILDAAACDVIAIDRDMDAQKRAEDLGLGAHFTFKRGCFGDVEQLLGGQKVEGFVIDIGVSSFQIDEAARGFSFRYDGPLDMRMDTASDLPMAADLVNTLPEEELANVIYKYGEERKSRRVAHKIVEMRKLKKFETTFELADAVRACVPKSKDGIDPATRTFQALRIAVNDELGELERALEASQHILKPGGRLVVVSFHSLEDTLVKRFFRDKSGTGGSGGSRYLPVQEEMREPIFKLEMRKAVKPSDKEVAENARSRSARLRWGVRL